MSTSEFNDLLLGNTQLLKPFAISLTNDREKASDLFQETMYRALANQDKYNIGTNIKAWLFTIMRNIFINDYRRKTIQRVIFDNDVHESKSKTIIHNDDEGTLQLKEIYKAIDQLPELFKIPFLLHFEGYRYHEISESLNEPLGTIKSRIHVARKLLKKLLKA